ncbi:MAG TPA: 2,3-bisphosphoglycerate-independent phosphoglycerate mutase [Chloroflexota bacterium]
MTASTVVSTLDLAKELAVRTPSRIVLLVIDGLGGLPSDSTGRTELETADVHNLDLLAWHSEVGLTVPLAPGITVGSGPGHLALFGYDPLEYRLGRGASSALGVDFPLRPGDVVARINFAAVDGAGLVLDRRAGRISDEEGERLCSLLDAIDIGVETFVRPEKGHRALVVFRGEGLSSFLSDSDPQHEGMPVLPVTALSPDGQRSAGLANRFIKSASERLRGEGQANAVLLRGFASHPEIPSMSEVYGLNPAAISAFPTYRGVARAVGMEVLATGQTLEAEVDTLEENWGRFDFFYLHMKWTDSAGEDGRFADKVRLLEGIDRIIPRIRGLGPDVLAVAGDHSTPSSFREHTWHGVPFLVHSRWCMPSHVPSFDERECALGNLGVFPATRAMLLLMGHAGKLRKFGA